MRETELLADRSTVLIEDVQSSFDPRHLEIDKVGIKEIRHPVRV